MTATETAEALDIAAGYFRAEYGAQLPAETIAATVAELTREELAAIVAATKASPWLLDA